MIDILSGGSTLTNLVGAAPGIASGLGGILSGGGLGSSFANRGGLVSGGSSGWGALGAALPAAGLLIGGIGLLVKGLSRKYAGSGIRGEFDADGFEGSSFDFYKGGFLRSNRTDYKPLDAELEAALDQSIIGMADGLKTMSSALGLGTESLANFNAEGFTIWINGKSQEQIQEELEAQMVATAEGMADLILTTEKFSKTGETGLETITQLGSSLLTVNDAFDVLGRRQFDQTLLGGHRAADLVASFGGVDQFNAQITGYYTAFYSESEKLETATRRMSEQFAELGLGMPKTRDGFRDRVEAQRLGTKEGREAYAALIGLSAGFDQLVTASENATQAVENVTEGLSAAARQERLSLRRQLLNLLGKESILRKMELRALDPANRALQERIWSIQDEQAALEAARAERQAALRSEATAISAELTRVNESAQEQIDRLSDSLSNATSRADAARSAVIDFINEIEDGSVGAFRRMRDEIRQVLSNRGALNEAQERAG